MVVGAVVEVLILVLSQGGVQIYGMGLYLVVQAVNDGFLVSGGGPLREPVGPDLCGGGDDAEIHRHIHIVH